MKAKKTSKVKSKVGQAKAQIHHIKQAASKKKVATKSILHDAAQFASNLMETSAKKLKKVG